MAEPAPKPRAIEQLLERATGRTTSIKADLCVRPPMGCGKPITLFKDAVSTKEYTISGLCQACQDAFFDS